MKIMYTPIRTDYEDYLKEVVNEVSKLYLDDLRTHIENLDKVPPLLERDVVWNEKAKELSPFRDKILELRECLTRAYRAQYEIPLRAATDLESRFPEVRDGDAASLLIDLLYARSLDEKGKLPSLGYLKKEEEKMKDELVVMGLSLEDVVEAVLVGRLGLSS